VEGAKEGDDVLAAGVIASQLQRALNRFRSGVAVVEAMRPRHGCYSGEPFRQRDHSLVVEVGAGHVDQLACLLLNGLDHLRMTVAGGGDSDAGGKVEELVAVHVLDPGASTALGYQRIAARVGGGYPAIIRLHDRACFGSGQRSGDARGKLGGMYFGLNWTLGDAIGGHDGGSSLREV
jgi:hypothetical protein